MKKVIALLTILTALPFSIRAADPVLTNPSTATLTVQHHDFAIRVKNPKKVSANSITGSGVTICMSDQFELISTQSNWDGVSEKSRYAYTINYRLRGTPTSYFTYSINLAKFSSIFVGRGQNSPTIVEEIGVIPNNERVAFETVSSDKIAGGNNPQVCLAGVDSDVHDIYYYEVGRLADGARYGKHGVFIYLLDKNRGKITRGYDTITPTSTGYTATIGTRQYFLDKAGKETALAENP